MRVRFRHRWAQEKIFFAGDPYFEAMLGDIRSAKRTILLEIYIFKLDQLGNGFIDAFIAAARRGVKIKILADGVGTPHTFFPRIEELNAHRIEIRIFHPVPRLLQFLRLKLTEWRRWVESYAWINRRDHRKLMVIDHRIAFSGGLNIMQENSERFSGTRAWRDTGVRVEGRAVLKLVEAFYRSYFRAAPISQLYSSRLKRWLRNRPKGVFSHPLIRLNETRKQRKKNLHALLKRFHRASGRIWITTAYFVPNRHILNAFVHAARRGVDVCLLVPAKSDIFFMHWAGRLFYNELLQNGVKIYEYKPRVLHAKTLLVDRWLVVGSSNLNRRSLYHDLELDIVLKEIKTLEAMERQYSKDLKLSDPIRPDDLIKQNLLVRLVSRILLLVQSYL